MDNYNYTTITASNNLETDSHDFVLTVEKNKVNFTLDFARTQPETYQTMDGFGTFIAPQLNTFTSRQGAIYGLTYEKQEEILDAIFSQETGAGFNMLRMEASCGDFYGSYFDNTGLYELVSKPYPTTPEERKYNEWDNNYNYLLDLYKRIQERGVDKLYLDSWSAPAYMKNNNSTAGKTVDGKEPTLKAGWEAAYADYLLQYIKYFKKSGIDVTHIGPYNEPDGYFDYQGMHATPAQIKAMIKALGQALENSGFSSVKIVMSENACMGRTADDIKPILDDPETAKYLGVASGHGYMNPLDTGVIVPPQNAIDAGIPVWMTEFSHVHPADWNPNYLGNMGGEEASRMMAHSLNQGISAYFDYAVDGNASSPIANQHLIEYSVENGKCTGEYEISSRLWAYANYSRYIRPGAERFGILADIDISTNATSNLWGTAFENKDGSYVLVVGNSNEEGRTININGVKDIGGKAPVIEQYITSQGHEMDKVNNLTAVVDNGSVTVMVPARSTVTFRFVESDEPTEP